MDGHYGQKCSTNQLSVITATRRGWGGAGSQPALARCGLGMAAPVPSPESFILGTGVEMRHERIQESEAGPGSCGLIPCSDFSPLEKENRLKVRRRLGSVELLSLGSVLRLRHQGNVLLASGNEPFLFPPKLEGTVLFFNKVF